MWAGAGEACGAGQERSADEVPLKVVMSLLGRYRSGKLLSLVPCAGGGNTLDEAMQTHKMSKSWVISHEAIERTRLVGQ